MCSFAEDTMETSRNAFLTGCCNQLRVIYLQGTRVSGSERHPDGRKIAYL